jgi:hypothetical protein
VPPHGQGTSHRGPAPIVGTVSATAATSAIWATPAIPATSNLGAPAVASVPAGPDGLFARADLARSAGRPEVAIGYLRDIVDRYPRDPHAPVAAFTIGRLLLESLKKPRQAAIAFAQARTLANGGPLGEDALAREVEALHTAGDASAAREQAELYVRLFPRGPRVNTVTRFGGLRSVP